MEAFGGDLARSVVDTNLTEKAYKFFELNKTMFGMTNPRSELKVYQRSGGEQGTEVDFKQFYKDLETSKDYIIATEFTKDKKLKVVSGTYYPDINLATTPMVTKVKALEKAIQNLDPKSKSGDRSSASPSLMVFPFMGKYHLAWFIFVNQWRYLIDANDGQIIHKEWIHPPCIIE